MHILAIRNGGIAINPIKIIKRKKTRAALKYVEQLILPGSKTINKNKIMEPINLVKNVNPNCINYVCINIIIDHYLV